jgi:GNAT superfamily N-acetyltransferase
MAADHPSASIPGGKVLIRRARRTDFTLVMKLLADSGLAVPPPERAVLRRFRNLVADLGSDLYLALVDGTLAGLVHVTYARQLSTPALADLAQLLVAESHRRRGIGRQLLQLAVVRARKRGCVALSCRLPERSEAATALLRAAGFTEPGWVCTLLLEPQ